MLLGSKNGPDAGLACTGAASLVRPVSERYDIVVAEVSAIVRQLHMEAMLLNLADLVS
jgi:hypothetical protein